MSIAYTEPPRSGNSATGLPSEAASILPGGKWVAGLFLATALTGTTANVPLPEVRVSINLPSRPGLVADETLVAETVSSSLSLNDHELVKWLKDASGLTWDQIAKVFGVSRRAVHLWVNGGRINASNAESLREFAALVEVAQGATSEATRATLLGVDSSGSSPLDKFRRWQYEKSTEINGTPFTPSSLLGTTKAEAQ